MKLKLLEIKNEIVVAQEKLEVLLESALPSNLDCTIGFPSGNVQAGVKYDQSLWFYSYLITDENTSPRYWNAFGLTSDLSDKKSNNIVVEINIPTVGINRRVSGSFAVDERGRYYLLHRGRVGGGRKGIGKSAFLNWANRSLVEVESTDKKESYLVIGCLNSKSFLAELNSFIRDVSNFKKYAVSLDLDDIALMSKEHIFGLLEVESSNGEVTRYSRSELVKEYTKRRANGRCQLCDNDAPFLSKNGTPFLEVHHIDWLSQGGVDQINNTIALCPNCHRKMHIINCPDDVKYLKELASAP